jgi:hypothetical protein
MIREEIEIFTALMMKAAHTSETSVFFNENTQHHTPQGCCLRTRCRENVRTHDIIKRMWFKYSPLTAQDTNKRWLRIWRASRSLEISVSSAASGAHMNPIKRVLEMLFLNGYWKFFPWRIMAAQA